MKRTLFEISQDLHALEDLLLDADGEITDEQTEKAIDEFFATLGAERDSKLDSYGALIKEFEAKRDARKAEAARILELAETDERNAKRLKSRLHSFLKTHDIQKIETLRFKIARQNNGGKLPVELDEYYARHPEELPEGLRRVVFQPDLDAIREYLAAQGETADAKTESEDTQKIGRLLERGEHLRIK